MPDSEPTLRDYYAAERTLLSWIRTTLAMMGFGFVVARFGVFLHELQTVSGSMQKSAGLSVWFGTLLIVFGVAIDVVAVRQYRREIAELNAAAARARATSALALWTSFGLAALGVLMAAYLMALHALY